MFIEPNEHIIIMDQGSNVLMPDELVMLRDAGIKTIYLTNGIKWMRIQPRPGVWYFEELDARIEDYEQAGLKAVIGVFGSSMPYWKPWDWFFDGKSPRGHGFHSYTNPETAAGIDDFAARLIERYRGKRVQFAYAMPASGEFPTPIPRGAQSPILDEDLAAWVVARQKQLEAQYNEVWSAFHFTCCPTYIIPTIEALKEAYPDSAHYSLQYKYFNQPHNVQAAVVGAQKKYGVQYYVGSEYVQGMKLLAPYAVQHGVRLLTSPIHSYQPRRRVEPWMLDVIRDTLGLYEEADA